MKIKLLLRDLKSIFSPLIEWFKIYVIYYDLLLIYLSSLL